jgi:hypothetical protein
MKELLGYEIMGPKHIGYTDPTSSEKQYRNQMKEIGKLSFHF